MARLSGNDGSVVGVDDASRGDVDDVNERDDWRKNKVSKGPSTYSPSTRIVIFRVKAPHATAVFTIAIERTSSVSDERMRFTFLTSLNHIPLDVQYMPS